MKIEYYPNMEAVQSAKSEEEPVLILVSFDKQEVLVAPIDDVVEHNIMLRKMERSEFDIDKYYRLVANGSGADWTFVCPSNYQGITDKIRRISRFYSDGYKAIQIALESLGYPILIEIPKRYHRHFDMLRLL